MTSEWKKRSIEDEYIGASFSVAAAVARGIGVIMSYTLVFKYSG
jgi:hypothetical protein